MRIHRKQIEGVMMLVLAAACFSLPHYLNAPRAADDKLLVATPRMDGGPFEHAVVFVFQHTGLEGMGFVINKKGAPGAPAWGGPVEDEKKILTLHSRDVTTDKTDEINGLDSLGVTEGDALSTSPGSKPREYIVFKGYAGWKMGQLDDELEHGDWKVIDFDRELLFHTDPDKIYDIAVQRPAAVPQE